jgi:sugar phosphate isomerase/epimerase
MCLDLGHAFITSDVIARLRDCADVIDYLHVHDNDGKLDAHLMPGDGAIDWPAVGRTLGDIGLQVPAMLEVFYLRDQLEKLAASDLPGKLKQWLAVR